MSNRNGEFISTFQAGVRLGYTPRQICNFFHDKKLKGRWRNGRELVIDADSLKDFVRPRRGRPRGLLLSRSRSMR